MQKTAKILYFMPDLSLDPNAGNRARVLSLLRFFKSKNFEVDYFGIEDWMPTPKDAVQKMLETKLVDRVFVGQRKPFRNNRLKRFFFHKIPELLFNRNRDNSFFGADASLHLCRQFKKVLKENTYDYILINYTNWSDIVRDKEYIKGARLIIDTHDFLTIQQYNKDRDKQRNRLGRIFQEEINRLNYFDEVWSVSIDEYYIFDQLLDANVELVPNISIYEQKDFKQKEKKYDLLYVASDNPYNRASAKWFFDHVYPLLDRNIQIKLVGRICNHVDDYPNVDKSVFIEDLSDIYAQSRVVLCPMLEGTGIKLKVLEAMSYGLPIVCNERGIDGLPNKINNGCLVSNDPLIFAQNIVLLLSDTTKYKELEAESRLLYVSYFLLERRLEQLEQLFSKHIDR